VNISVAIPTEQLSQWEDHLRLSRIEFRGEGSETRSIDTMTPTTFRAHVRTLQGQAGPGVSRHGERRGQPAFDYVALLACAAVITICQLPGMIICVAIEAGFVTGPKVDSGRSEQRVLLVLAVAISAVDPLVLAAQRVRGLCVHGQIEGGPAKTVVTVTAIAVSRLSRDRRRADVCILVTSSATIEGWLLAPTSLCGIVTATAGHPHVGATEREARSRMFEASLGDLPKCRRDVATGTVRAKTSGVRVLVTR
jgi:hypothetical protein